MRVLVAGATGAIGRPLVTLLQQAGHDVSATARSHERAAALEALGVKAHVCDVFDRGSVMAAVAAAAPEVLVHQLTAIPMNLDIRRYAQQIAPTGRLRRETTPHFLAAAQAAGVRRVIFQSIAFMTAPTGPTVHDEDAPLFLEGAPKAFAGAVADTAAMEGFVTGADGLEGIVLRYGFFYGPGTSYAPGVGPVEEIRKRRFPIVGGGTGVSSFVHIQDAAEATVAALQGGTPGVYNVCDDEPAPMSQWLPHMARASGAKPPRRVPAWVGRLAAGAHAVHFATALRGNDNTRFKREFGWAPAHASWRTGFPEVMR